MAILVFQVCSSINPTSSPTRPASHRIACAWRAAGRGAKLLLIELLLPDASAPNWPTTLDIVMLVIGGRQRTLQEYSDLFRDAGFAMTRTIDTPAGIAIIEAAAV